MRGDLFRITVDESNYSRVLKTPPDESLLADAELSDLRGCRLWAQKNTAKGQQVYHSMEPGDGLLFYKVKRGIASDEGMYVGTGRVGEKVRLGEEQARTLFRTTVATLAYTVNEFNQIRKSIEDIERVLGYGSHPQSSHRVTDDRYTTVDRALQTLSQ